MKHLIYLTALILLTTGCNQSNGTAYKTSDGCEKGRGCLGRNGNWYIRNDSFNRKIKFIYERTTTVISTGKKKFKILKIVLYPGETSLIGCVEISCANVGWTKVDIKIVGEMLPNSP